MNNNNFNPNFIVKGIVGFLMFVGLMMVTFTTFEHLDASEVMVVQYPNGAISSFTTPGWHGQYFGTVTTYPKRLHYDFENKIQFSDRGHAVIKGSSDFDMPLDEPTLTKLHQTYRSADALQNALITKSVDKSVFTVGSLMSSKESSAEKRNDLIRLIEDQIDNGVYMLKTEDQEITEDTGKYDDKGTPITARKNIKVMNLVADPKGPGGKARQDKSPTAEFGIKSFNFAISAITYDDVVEKQFQEQQALQMQIQKAIVQRRTSEQEAITVKAQGEAAAAKARAEQEVIKAKMTTEAETRRDVAELERKTAELNKARAILEGEGEAAKKRLVMQADGALTQKLAAYVEVQKAWAHALATTQHPLTPMYVMGGGSSQNAATSLESLLSIKTMRDLGVSPAPAN